MWHEARKQEKKIRGMIVDYRKRAERRRDFYEKFKADPTQFLQLHGRSCKIHLDSAIAAAGDAASIMMPWQGCQDLLIDRFDARAHMDYIKENPPPLQDETLSYDERVLNYERYRILVQNEYLGVEEEKFLHQIYLEEQFGPIALKQTHEVEKEKDKRRKGAAIGFNYEDSTSGVPPNPSQSEEADGNESNSDNSELDFDLCLDLSEVDTASAHELNNFGQHFGLVSNDFYSFLTNDVEEQESLRLAKEEEEEKAMYSGRKARRERQAFRERRLQGRVMSPPSYAARQSPVYDKYSKHSKSRSRSVTPDNAGTITYITSFGEEENVESHSTKKASSHVQSKSKTPPRKIVKSSPNSSRRSRSPSYDSQKRPRPYSPARSSDRRSFNSRDNRDSTRSTRRWNSRSRSRSRGRNIRRSRSNSHSRFSHRRSRSWSRDRRRSRSKSRNRRIHSRSRSRSRQRSDNSPTIKKSNSTQNVEKMDSAPAVPRYYGRNRKNSSSSLDVSSSDETQGSASNSIKNNDGHGGRRGVGGSRSDSKPPVKYQPRETPQEKMKRRMQALINKQFKQDKRLEREKAEQLERERLDRAAELRDIAIKIRRRERYLRHRDEDDDDDDRDSRDSRSPSSRSPRSIRPSRSSRSPRPTRNSRSPRPSRSPRLLRSSRSPPSPLPRFRRSRSRSSSPRHSRRSSSFKRKSPSKKSLVDY